MKKNTTANNNQKALSKAQAKRICQKATKQRLTVGLDLGDRNSHYCILEESGETASEGGVPTTAASLQSLFGKMPSSRIALEVGTHSPWVSRLLGSLGHEVIVANARKVRLISQATKKNDRMDAEQLARLARVDPKLLAPIHHRGAEAQADLAVIRARALLVETRTALVNGARGLVKPMGGRLKPCDSDQVGEDLVKGMGAEVKAAVGPLLKSIEELTKQIAAYDQQLAEVAKRWPEVKLLTQVYGVGTLIGLSFILTLEDAQRFRYSRDVGAFLGLQPKQHESGERQPQLGISKQGDRLVRMLLVQAAHCILRKGAPDSDLQAWGLAKMEGRGKNNKKRAVVAVARKLGVLLHRLWVTGEVYDPLYNRKAMEAAQSKGKGKAAA